MEKQKGKYPEIDINIVRTSQTMRGGNNFEIIFNQNSRPNEK